MAMSGARGKSNVARLGSRGSSRGRVAKVDRAGPKASPLQARLASKIVDLLRNGDFAPGHHITEEFLTEQFGVSRSPVRGALRLLAEHGVLQARVNHGYFLRKSGDSIAATARRIPVAKDDELYDLVTADLFADKFPAEFKESDLIRRYGVKRASLIRVLLRLFEEGLVQRRDGHGWAVLPSYTSIEGHKHSYRFRMIIEPAALLEPDFTVDQVRMQDIRRRHEEFLDTVSTRAAGPDWLNLNASFHQMLADFSGNPLIQQAIRHQNRMRRLGEYRAAPGAERIATSCREHLAILEAIERGDLQWAAALLKQHLFSASKLKLAWLATVRPGKPSA